MANIDCFNKIKFSLEKMLHFSGIGISAMIPDNKTAMALMLIFRLMQGATNLGGCKTHVEGCKIWFKEKYRLALGVVNGGYYVGTAFCSVLGGYAYDHYKNFTIPFLLIGVCCCSIVILNLVVLPSKEESVLNRGYEEVEKEPLHWKEIEALAPSRKAIEYSLMKGKHERKLSLISREVISGSIITLDILDTSMIKGKDESTWNLITPIEEGYKETNAISASFACKGADLSVLKDSTCSLSLLTQMEKGTPTKPLETEVNHQDEDVDTDSLTLFAAFPTIAAFFLDATYGYTVAIVAPYLLEVFKLSVSQAGFYVMVLNLAMAFGSFLSGLLMQKNLLTSSKIMGLSAVMSITGHWFLFQSSAVPLLHNSVPYTAFFSLFFIGCAIQSGSMASFKAIEDLQVTVLKKSFGRTTRSTASSVFYTIVTFAGAAGAGITVVVIDYLDYGQGSWIIIGGLLITFVISVGLEITLKFSHRRDMVCSVIPVTV